jgi:hypothetical protein
MSFNLYPNGAGGTTGDQIAVNSPLILGTSGHIWYVNNSVAGAADAASPAGRERDKPLRTLSQAITNATSGDVIILGVGHAETIGAAINTAVKALTIVSEGTGSSRARLTCGVAGAVMLTLAAPGSSINNIYFPASTVVPTSRIDFTAGGCVSDNCYFECGANDTGRTFRLGSGSSFCQLTNAYFLATASQPAIAVESPNATSGFFMENVTFDGGSFGFSDFAFKAPGVLTSIYANQIHQLNNADVSLAATWTGVWNVGQKSGSARFEG